VLLRRFPKVRSRDSRVGAHDLPFSSCESSFFRSPLSLCIPVAVIAFGKPLIVTLAGLLLPERAVAGSIDSCGPFISAVMLGMILAGCGLPFVVGISFSGGGSENGLLTLTGKGDGGLW
jgi:hypothetical protein